MNAALSDKRPYDARFQTLDIGQKTFDIAQKTFEFTTFNFKPETIIPAIFARVKPLIRLIQHFNLPFLIGRSRNAFNTSKHSLIYRFVSGMYWIILLPIKTLELLGFFYLLDFFQKIIQKNRHLSAFETKELAKIFGDSVNYKSIRIRENSYLAKVGAKSAKKTNIGFVLFRVIRFSRTIDTDNSKADMAWLVHELTHVSQFRKLGFVYIIEAMRAQRNGGYNYGGLETLTSITKLSELNLEQQAEVAKHYYQCLLTETDTSVYERFVKEIRRQEF